MARASRTEPLDPFDDQRGWIEHDRSDDRSDERDPPAGPDRFDEAGPSVRRALFTGPVWSRATEVDDDPPGDDPPGDGTTEDAPAAARRPVSLEGVSIAGITRRRTAFALGAIVTLWIVVAFARQVSDASAATARADEIRAQNAALTTDVAALQAELRLIQERGYVEQQARGYGLGMPQERPFALAPGASPLASDAPGSAALRLGATPETRSPLETWLSLLFGPSPR